MATVKGDVHDIGKNIVGVVLGCNNFKVGPCHLRFQVAGAKTMLPSLGSAPGALLYT